MQHQQLFHDLLKNASHAVHNYRLNALISCADSLLNGAMLTVTNLGRYMKGEARVKHKIKRANRLLNNQKLYCERIPIYKATTHRLLGNLKKAIVLVDWSPFKHKRDYGVLRATIGIQGRSITLYQETSVYAEVMRKKHQKQFLSKLKEILPLNCHVIMVTDMGFQGPWFKLVRGLGWDFIGRIRRDVKWKSAHGEWQKIFALKPNKIPKCLKNHHLFVSHPIRTNLILYKKMRARKQKLSRNPTVKQYQKAASSGWILATSTGYSAKKVCAIYRQRMLIETSFRDVKSYRFGMGLNMSLQKTSSLIRRELMLLIAHLAQCALLIIGWLAMTKQWHLHFQVNSIKNKKVYSLIFLGMQVARHYQKRIRKRDIDHAIKSIIDWFENIFDDLLFCGDS